MKEVGDIKNGALININMIEFIGQDDVDKTNDNLRKAIDTGDDKETDKNAIGKVVNLKFVHKKNQSKKEGKKNLWALTKKIRSQRPERVVKIEKQVEKQPLQTLVR